MEISKLLTTLGVITLDPGFTNTGSTTSAVTYIDGDVGHPALPRATRSSSWRRTRTSWRPATC